MLEILILAIVAALVVLALRSIRKQRKNGGCGCGCAGCSGCSGRRDGQKTELRRIPLPVTVKPPGRGIFFNGQAVIDIWNLSCYDLSIYCQMFSERGP